MIIIESSKIGSDLLIIHNTMYVYFSENVERYCLHIAEDDGEVDMDFPSLDPKEPASKFGFNKLALVEKDLPTATSPKSSFVVTV